MAALVLISLLWFGVLLLILHDVTANERKSGAILQTAKKAIASAKKLGASSRPSVVSKQAETRKKKWWMKDHRVSMTAAELELTISDAVKNAAPACEEFVGVVVQRKNPKLHLDPNWSVRGVKFGKADRRLADEALTTVVKRLQQDYVLSDPQS